MCVLVDACVDFMNVLMLVYVLVHESADERQDSELVLAKEA